MNCHDFEARLEALSSPEEDRLSDFERAACLRHAEGCAECRELLALARLAEPPEELLAGVMASTSGPACDHALERLAERAVSGSGGDALVALHLEGCGECRALAGVMAALAADLPGLAEVRPDPAFVDDVLARSLPAAVRLRRGWAATAAPAISAISAFSAFSATWARWARRPRFAWEAAFVVTVAFLPAIVSSGPALAAAPARAVELAQEAAPDEAELDARLRELREIEAVRQTEEGLGTVRATFGVLGDGVGRGAGAVVERVIGGYGTLRDLAASFLSKGGEDETSPEAQDTAPAP